MLLALKVDGGSIVAVEGIVEIRGMFLNNSAMFIAAISTVCTFLAREPNGR